MTKCGSCGGTSWTLQEVEVQNSRWKYMAIQCASCSVAVSFVDWFNVPTLIRKLATKLKIDLT